MSYTSKQANSWFTHWSEMQKNWWGNWFDILSSSAASQGVQAASVWQQNVDTWRRSVETGLQLQEGFIQAWTPQKLEGQEQKVAKLKAQSAKLAKRKPNKLVVGAEASLTKKISKDDVISFAELSGDVNPVHLNEAYAKKTRFKKPIAHGMLSAGLISAVLGTKLPGPGAIYLSQSLAFKAPVYVGDKITAYVKVLSQKASKPIYTLETICRNQDDVVVLQGEAVILFEP